MKYQITLETAPDSTAITNLIDTCFGAARKSRTVYTFRKNTKALSSLCLCAKGTDGTLYGSLRFWPVTLPNGDIIPLFGPLAVAPSLQGNGIGKSLIMEGHKIAEQAGYPALLIIGKPSYYEAFGYHEKLVTSLSLPGPVSPLTFMGKEIVAGTLLSQSGMIRPA